MLKRQHKLRLDANSIVGYVASRGEPRIALDVGTDMVFFNNPDLPNTRSEMALPLRIAGNTIGVLDVQSEQPNAYSEEDISTLSTLADQVAVAIENARLFSQAREALKESERAFEIYIQQEWKSFALQVKSPGYLFDGEKTIALASTANTQQVKSLPQTGRLSLLEQGTNEIGYPIKLRGKTIGILNVKPKQGNRQWTKDELVLLEAAAERAALALENARLVESAQRRAARERAIGDISVKIGAVSGLEAILQTAVEELGRKIGGSTEVIFEFGDVEDQTGHQ
jgi:GAF domain-containing protein